MSRNHVRRVAATVVTVRVVTMVTALAGAIAVTVRVVMIAMKGEATPLSLLSPTKVKHFPSGKFFKNHGAKPWFFCGQ